eukprot:1692340-Pleurochrysis_carterae.AAC.6
MRQTWYQEICDEMTFHESDASPQARTSSPRSDTPAPTSLFPLQHGGVFAPKCFALALVCLRPAASLRVRPFPSSPLLFLLSSGTAAMFGLNCLSLPDPDHHTVSFALCCAPGRA